MRSYVRNNVVNVVFCCFWKSFQSVGVVVVGVVLILF